MSKDVYPDQEVWNYIQTELEKRDISLNEIATHAWEHQRQFNSELTIDEAEMAVRKVLSKREVRNAIMVALAIDNLANAHQLPEPLQTIIAEDNPCFGSMKCLPLTGLPNFTGQSPFQISATLMSINQTQPKSLIPRKKMAAKLQPCSMIAFLPFRPVLKVI